MKYLKKGKMKMGQKSRRDRIYEWVSMHTREQILLYGTLQQGALTQELADILNIDRSNVSRELNILVREGLTVKVKSRPAQYFSLKEIKELIGTDAEISGEFGSIKELMSFSKVTVQKSEKKEAAFQSLIGYDDSLADAVKKAKAAVLYPPLGLATLLTGETGVGKSLFAKKMYQYAIEKGVLTEKSPFISFNCADYADNEQLLLSQLFGYVKGSFTGANGEREGLVGEADGGILFLDEIHRLGAKGQEMLFSLMDKNEYRKLGQTGKPQRAEVRIIAATTEEPTKVMLNTFLRRIPMHIRLSSMAQKSMKERLMLINSFFSNEASDIGKKIQIEREILCIFLKGNYTGNIGQLKSDVQFTCANAFLRAEADHQKILSIKRIDIPDHLQEDVFEYSNKFNRGFFYSLPAEITYPMENIGSFLYLSPLPYGSEGQISESGDREDKAEKEKRTELLEYVVQLKEQYLSLTRTDEITFSSNKSVMETLVDRQLVDLISKYVKICEHNLDRVQYCAQLLAYHLGKVKRRENNKGLYLEPKDFNDKIVWQMFDEIASVRNWYYEEKDIQTFSGLFQILISGKDREKVALLIIMHGDSTASSMAKVAKEVLQTDEIYYINMHLDDNIQNVYEKTVRMIVKIDRGAGVLILADMGSICSFEKPLKEKCGFRVRIVDSISTPVAIEAANLVLLQKKDLEEVYQIVSHLTSYKAKEDDDINLRYFDRMLIKNLRKILHFLDAEKVYNILEPILKKICMECKVSTSDDFIVKFMFHSACMVERMYTGEVLLFNGYEDFIKKWTDLYRIVKKSFCPLEEYYDLEINPQEICHIMEVIIYEYPEIGMTHK